MGKFKSTSRTVVTDIKSFIVDNVARTGAFRQSVSARIPNDVPFNRQDVNVSSLLPFELDDVSAIVSLHTPEPVRVVLTQLIPTPDPEIPDDTPAPPMFDVPDSIFADDVLPIALRDESIRSLGVANIVVLNLVTGETETVLLQSTEPGVFEGTLPTALSSVKGMDFDGIMGVINGHSLLLRYSSGNDVLAEVETQIKSQYVDASITVPNLIFVGNPLPIVIEDKDLSGRVLSANVINLSTGQELNPILTEIENGVFYTQIDTSDVGQLSAEDGHSISISFTSDKFSNVPTVEKVVLVSNPYPVPVALSIDESIGVGDKILVALSDYNRVGASSISIVVSNVRSRDFVMVTCSESVPNSGIFVGELPTRLGNSRDGVLGIEPGDTVSAVYVDTSRDEPLRIESIGNVEVSDASPAFYATKEVADSNTDAAQTEQSVEFIVNGLFFLNGTFDGKISVYGLSEEHVRCSIIYA